MEGFGSVRMKRLTLVLALTMSLTCGPSALGSPAGDGCRQSYSAWTASSCARALGWDYDPAAGRFVKPSSVVDAGETRRFQYELQERCFSDADCGSAHTCPPSAGQDGRRYRSLAFLLNSTGQRESQPPISRTVCVYPGESVPLAVVEAAAHEEIRKRIPSPSVVSSPPGQSVVNLFTIFSTVPAAEQAITFTAPVPGEVRAVPEYVWDFGDGLTGVGPGKPFDPGVLPSKNRGYYLGATYAKPGSKHVTVTVTWRVTFRLEGVTSVPLAPIVMTASEDKPIATAKAVLVR